MEAKVRRKTVRGRASIQPKVVKTRGVTSRAAIRSFFGDVAKVGKELREFKDAASVLSSDHPRLIDKYPKQWVAVYRGTVVANSKSFPEVMAELDRKAIPRKSVIVRFIERNQRTMIL